MTIGTDDREDSLVRSENTVECNRHVLGDDVYFGVCLVRTQTPANTPATMQLVLPQQTPAALTAEGHLVLQTIN